MGDNSLLDEINGAWTLIIEIFLSPQELEIVLSFD